jgi:hypothetical protein
MSRIWHVAGALALGFLVSAQVSATTMEMALAEAAWDEPMVGLENEAKSAVELAGELYATDADSILACGACEDSACDKCAPQDNCSKDNCCDDSCCDDSCCGGDCGAGVGSCCPKWFATIGVIALDREDPTPGTIVAANPAGTRFFGAEAFDFDFEAGVEVGLARRFDNGCILEGRYFGIDHTAASTIVTPGNFIGTGFTGPGGTTIAGRYLTMLDSTEINIRRQHTDRLTLLGGFRMIELRDQARFMLNANVARGHYDYDNRLYGGQLGSNLDLSPRSNSRILANVETKAGVYNNLIEGGINEFQGFNFIGTFNGDEANTAFVGEINLNTGLRLTDHVTLRTGYQLLWIENVALASDAAVRSLLNPSLLRTVSDDQGLFYHGATGGIDVVW